MSYLFSIAGFTGAQSESPSINTDFKSEFVAVKTTEFYITLHKSNLTGPARLKLISGSIYPELTAVSLSSGQLISNDNYYSVTWTDLPSDSTIKMKFQISFPETDELGHQIKFIFSYNDGGTSVEKTLNTFDFRLLPAYFIKGERKINQIGENKFKVIIELEKPLVGGFARLYEKLPEGTKAVSIDCEGGAFRSENGMLKISWDDFLDNKKSVLITYYIEQINTFPEISGTLSAEFLSGKYDNFSILTTEKNILKTEIAATETKVEMNEIAVIHDVIICKDTAVVVLKKEEPVEISLNSPDTIFRVQFAASQPGVSSSYFANKYKITETIYVEQIDGYSKFSLGKFSNFDEALKKRNELGNSAFKNPFIIAIVNGKRVPFDQNKRK